ncbi:hypothetical protein L0337_36160 [candidate division KSB1 bacterium]|nr:hypothetical protein [candidate division KSB1 bacterium]
MKKNFLQNRNNAIANELRRALVIVLLAHVHCSEKNVKTVTDPGTVSASTLHYDRDNLSSPSLAAGQYEAAARFTNAQIGNLVGREVIEVHYYIADKPESCRVKIYGPQSASLPGSLLYSAEVTTGTQAKQWNIHKLTQPVRLTGNDLWISLEFAHSIRQATVGCDPGPAVKDGDWLYATSDHAWTPLSQRTSISINWNIRGVVK